MNFNEQLNSLREKIKAKITTDSTPEEITGNNELLSDLGNLEASHNELVNESAKLKDTIVRMVTSQGNGDKPVDASNGSNPKSIEECVAEELLKEKK